MTDLQDFLIYRSNPDITEYQGFDVMTYEQAENFIRENTHKNLGIPGEWIQYGIVKKETGKIIGDCAVRFTGMNHRTGEIGITISHLEQRKGYAIETIIALVDHFFKALQLYSVVVKTDVENTGANELLKKTGFRQKRQLVENVFFKGKQGSEYHYTLLNTEWNK